jgi:hypothetical protein
MSKKALGFLAGITIVLVVTALTSSRKTERAATTKPGQTLLPGLELNAIEQVQITTEGKIATLAKQEGTWVVTSKHSFPANFNKLREQLLKLSDLKVGQIMKVDDAQKAELKITGPAAGRVELLDKAGTPLATLILGETRERPAPQGSPYGAYPDGRFVSADNGKSVILVADSMSDLSSDSLGWVDTELLNLPGVEIVSIHATPAAGGAFLLSRADGEGELELADLGDDESIDDSKLYGLQNALNYLRFDDLAEPELDDAALGFATADRFEATTKDHILYTLLLGATPKDGSGRYCRISASLMKKASTDAPEEPETALPPPENNPAETVAKVNAKLAGWTFLIPAYKADGMSLSRAALIKPKEENAELTPAEDSEPAPETIPPAPEPTSPPPLATPLSTAEAAPVEAAAPVPTPVTEPAPTEAVPTPEVVPPVPPSPSPDVTEATPEESLGTPVPEAPQPAATPIIVEPVTPDEIIAITTVPVGPEPQK